MLTSTFPRWQGDNEPPFVYELSRRLGERFEVLVLAPHAPLAKCRENIGKLEVHRFRYFFTPWQGLAYHGGIIANLKQNQLRYLLIPFFFLFEIASLVSLLKKYKIDLIHAHWLIPQGLVAIIARSLVADCKPKILCTSHGTDMVGLKGYLFRWLQKKIITKVDKLTVVSTALSEYASSLSNRDDVKIIPMGVDVAGIFKPSTESVRSSNELLFVGRLVEQKGLQYLIQALPDILNMHPQVKLTIVGEGPERKKLQQVVVTLGLNDQVHFLGAIENSSLIKMYRRATLFVSPSLAEGLGLTLVESLACCCPVVATDLPAIRDVVIDGVTGLVCRQKNSADLAKKICFLLENPELRKSFGESGRRHVQEHFDWEIITRRYATLFNDLICEQP